MGGRGILAGAVACCATLAAALLGASAADAAVQTVSLNQSGSSPGSPVVIAAGDSVTFADGVATNPVVTQGFYVVLAANPSAGLASSRTLKRGNSVTLVFPSPGSWTFVWRSYDALGIQVAGAQSVAVHAMDTNTGSPTPTGSSGGGDSTSVPPGGATSGGGNGTPPAGLTGAPGLPGGASATSSGGAAFSFGPHPDTGSPTRASTSVQNSAASSSSGNAAVPYLTTSVAPAQPVAKAPHASPPALLAVLAIIVFAGVGAGYAYQRFGPNAARTPTD